MRFDETGFLALGDQTKFSSGSSAARALLNAAVRIPHAAELEFHAHSPQVAFARLPKPITHNSYSL